MQIDEVLFGAEEAMEKAVEYLRSEMRGMRTGRASTGLVEFVKVDYYGSMTDLRSIAHVSVPEPSQLLIKPFDASTVQAIIKAIQSAGLGLNPVGEGKQIRLSLPSLSGDRRTQLVTSLKHKGEEARVTIRNARRDANKHIEAAEKDKTQKVSEDDVKRGKEDVQELLKKYEAKVDEMVAAKTKEIMEI
ncbi:MAG: ribosome recycling factor [Planctomycetota bacterium]|nr:ribosome recycling factor [Planctomycetota bacterium]